MGWRRRALISIVIGIVLTVLIAWWPKFQLALPKKVSAGLRATVSVKNSYQIASVSSKQPMLRDAEPVFMPNVVWIIVRHTTVLSTDVQLGYYFDSSERSESRSSFSSRDDLAKFVALGTELGDLQAEIELERKGIDLGVRSLLGGPVTEPGQSVSWYGAGWPCRALCYKTDESSTPADRFSFPGGVVIRKESAPTPTTKKFVIILPLRPIWPGFALDVMLFAGVWSGLVFGFGSILHAVRRKRGRCVRCGYDRHGLAAGAACPECSAAAGT